MPVGLSGLFLVVAGLMLGTGGDASGQAVAPEWRGIYGGPGTPTFVVARTEAEWRAVQAVFNLGDRVPAVDLGKDMVVAVGLGSRPTGGYSVSISGVEERNGVVHVRYRERRPAAGEFVTQAVTAPFHVRVVPRREAPAIVFEASVGGE